MMHKLTKTDFLQYLACPEELWLSINKVAGIKVSPSLDELHIMEQGRLIDDYAQNYFTDHLSQELEAKGFEVEFQKTGETEGFLARADVVAINSKSNALDIYEVKASTSIKDEHIQDIAFQKMVFEASAVSLLRKLSTK